MLPATLVVASVLVSAQAQAQPNFAGRWTLDVPSSAPSDATRVLIVEQPLTRTNVRGEAMPPAYLHLSVRREGPSGTTTATYSIGIVGGTVGPVGTPVTRFETAWHGETLDIVTRRDETTGVDQVRWSERRESWSLDPDGRLRVEIISESHDRPKETSVLLYRRAPISRQN
jgi:hypothetical protein